MKKYSVIIIILLMFWVIQAEAVTRTISNAGGNWSANGTWAEGSPPDATMDVVATATSGSITIDTTTCVAKTVDFTNYPGTSTVTFTAAKILGVSGNFKMISGMNITGTGMLKINAAATLTSGTLTFPGALTFNVNGTVALADNWTVTGLVTNATATLTLNSNQITCNGGLAISNSTTGTTKFVLAGGTCTSTLWMGFTNNVDIAGNPGFGNFHIMTGTFRYVSGTPVTTSANLLIDGNVSLDIGGMPWAGGISNQSTGTMTLLSAINSTGTAGLFGITFSGNYNITVGTLFVYGVSSATLTLVSGTTLTVTTRLVNLGGTNGGVVNMTMKSSTASSPAYLVYQGTQANSNIVGTIFTDIDASGSVRPIYNYQGGTLTRTTNIYNVVLPPNSGYRGIRTGGAL